MVYLFRKKNSPLAQNDVVQLHSGPRKMLLLYNQAGCPWDASRREAAAPCDEGRSHTTTSGATSSSLPDFMRSDKFPADTQNSRVPAGGQSPSA